MLAAGLGLAGGGAAFVLLRLIGLLTNIALFYRVGWSIPSFAHFHPGPGLIAVAAAGGLVVSLLAKWSPEIKGHGIPEAMEAVLTNQSRIRPRTAVAKPISAAIAIGTGGPFGAEGPIIVTAGALGSLLGQVLPMSASERKILLACGAAAGMAATFGAPLASVVLAIELLLFEFSARAFIPLVVSTALAAGVHSAIFGTGPLFAVPAHNYAGLDKLFLYAVLGVACGLLAVLVNHGMFLTESAFRRLPLGEFWHPIIGAVGFALIGLFVPRALGVGYDAISDVLRGRLALGALAALAAAKLAAWWVALGSGTSGGTLAPLLLISGAFGSLVGTLFQHLVPSAHVAPGAFALVAMAAAFGASIRATFTAIVFLFELTRDYQIILPLMLASVLAELVATALTRDSLMTEKLTRRGLRVQGDYEADVLQTTMVADVMTQPVVVVSDTATIAVARQMLESDDHDALPVVTDSGRCIAMVSRRDLLPGGLDPSRPVTDAVGCDVVTVPPDASVLEALHHMLEDGVGHLPVVDGDRLVGICTRSDILRARLRQFQREHLQPGWQPLQTITGWPQTLGRRLHRRIVDALPSEAVSIRKENRPMRRYLVVANETLGDETLMEVIGKRLAEGPCHFHVVVPAPGPTTLFGSALAAYEGNEPGGDESQAAARRGLDQELARLQHAGAEVDGEIADHDPLEAIRTALEDRQIDEIILSTLPAGISRWLHFDLPHRVQRRFELPVTHVESHRGPVDVSLDQHPPDATPESTSPLIHPDDDRLAGTGPAEELERLERDIERVRADVARFHHHDERHFYDAETAAAQTLLESQEALDRLAERWRTSGQQSKAGAEPCHTVDDDQRLTQLRRHIEQAHRDLDDARHKGERRFCD